MRLLNYFCTSLFILNSAISANENTILNKSVNFSVYTEFEVPATIANVDIEIIKNGKTLIEASNKCHASINVTKSNLMKNGLKSDDISTNSFISFPKYSLFTGKIKKYEIEAKLKISTRDIDQLAKILSSLVDIDEDLKISNISFAHHNEDSLRHELINKSAEKARGNKAAFEKANNIKLTLNTISETPPNNNLYQEEDLYFKQKDFAPMKYSSSKIYYSKNVPILEYDIKLYYTYNIVE